MSAVDPATKSYIGLVNYAISPGQTVSWGDPTVVPNWQYNGPVSVPPGTDWGPIKIYNSCSNATYAPGMNSFTLVPPTTNNPPIYNDAASMQMICPNTVDPSLKGALLISGTGLHVVLTP